MGCANLGCGLYMALPFLVIAFFGLFIISPFLALYIGGVFGLIFGVYNGFRSYISSVNTNIKNSSFRVVMIILTVVSIIVIPILYFHLL